MNKGNKQTKANQPITNRITNNNNLTINYVTDLPEHDNILENPVFVSDSTENSQFDDGSKDVTLPIFFGDYKTVQIPKGVIRRIKRLPKGILKLIDSDINIAVEKCIIMTSNLTYSVFKGDNYWKSLSSKILHQQFKKGADNTIIYKNIIEALKYQTNSTEPIISCKESAYSNETYREGHYTKQYKLDSSSINTSLKSYQIQYEDNINKRKSYYFKQFNEANTNIIGRNLIKVYEYIKLPTNNEIINEAKKLVKANHQNKKGKKLTFLKKKPKSYYSNPKDRTFVEDNIKLYDFLVGVNFIIPKIGDFKSGGRVVDSFNLMPSWIRSLIKIEDEPIVELDFKALHPNIASSIYGDVNYQITHESLEKALELPLKEVKIEHLSFFNKRIDDMKKSPLFDYYYKSEKEMLKNLMNEKIKYKSHKITSQKLFKKEVSIMSSIIKKLNDLEIYVIYVYDALYCKRSDRKIVKKIMNRVIQNHGVNTCVG